MKKISQRDIDTLALVFDAVCGKVSEEGPECFDHFYRAGDGEKMMNDFQATLIRLGVNIIQC